MLSPDNYIQAAFGSQGYNRYSYAVNNPLRFTDPSGEWVHIVAGALIGGVSGAVQTRLYNRNNPSAPVNYWIGRDVAPGRSPWAFKNTPHPRSGYILRSFQARDGSTNTFTAWSLEKTEGGVKTYEIWGSTYHDAWDIITSGQGNNLNTINKAIFNTLTGYRVQFYFQSSPSSGSHPTLSFQRPDGKAYLKLRFR